MSDIIKNEDFFKIIEILSKYEFKNRNELKNDINKIYLELSKPMPHIINERTKIRHNYVCDLYKKGYSIYQIIQEAGYCEALIKKILRKNNLLEKFTLDHIYKIHSYIAYNHFVLQLKTSEIIKNCEKDLNKKIGRYKIYNTRDRILWHYGSLRLYKLKMPFKTYDSGKKYFIEDPTSHQIKLDNSLKFLNEKQKNELFNILDNYKIKEQDYYGSKIFLLSPS